MDMPDRSAILAEALTMMSRPYIDPPMHLLYTRKRCIGHVTKGILWFDNHDTELCQAIWRAYLDSLEPERPRSGFTSEVAFVTYVAQQLQDDGWRCQREVRTRYGRIDLLAERAMQRWIIEAKLSMHAPDVTCALGQLLCGQEAYPDATLWFATPAPIQPRWNILFVRYAIHILEGPWTKAME